VYCLIRKNNNLVKPKLKKNVGFKVWSRTQSVYMLGQKYVCGQPKVVKVQKQNLGVLGQTRSIYLI